ncbi:MAG: hypothetical protein ACO3NZ_00785 [Pirellulales bacterium]
MTHPKPASRWGTLLVVVLALTVASCADYESDYQAQWSSYVDPNTPSKATAAAADGGGQSAPAATPSADASGSQPMSYGSGSAPAGGSSAGGSSPEGFQTIGSGATGVILPGG